MKEKLNDTLGLIREAVAPTNFTAQYWQATCDKKLLLQFCRRTNRFQHYPRPASSYTGHRDLEWRESSGRGEIYSYTIMRRIRGAFHAVVPFAIAAVKLDEGVVLIANLINAAEDEIVIGMRVKPSWAPLPDGRNLLMFEPDI